MNSDIESPVFSDEAAWRPARPPSLAEVLLLPAAGAVVIELLHTPATERLLFLCPFIIVVIRMYLAQMQLPPPAGEERDRAFDTACRRCIAWNQVAAFVLLLLECSVVVAGSPKVPHFVWNVVGSLYLLYVGLRWVSRKYWLAAAERTEPSKRE
jgi:hypothetical protein